MGIGSVRSPILPLRQGISPLRPAIGHRLIGVSRLRTLLQATLLCHLEPALYMTPLCHLESRQVETSCGHSHLSAVGANRSDRPWTQTGRSRDISGTRICLCCSAIRGSLDVLAAQRTTFVMSVSAHSVVAVRISRAVIRSFLARFGGFWRPFGEPFPRPSLWVTPLCHLEIQLWVTSEEALSLDPWTDLRIFGVAMTKVPSELR